MVPALIMVAAPCLGALGIVVLRRVLVLVMVTGSSMSPRYRDGDRVLVLRLRFRAITAGRVVVIERPNPGQGWKPPGAALQGRAGPWMIKRVAAVAGDRTPLTAMQTESDRCVPIVPSGMLVVLGDNVLASYDSREIGFVPIDRVLGVVVHRLRPRSLASSEDL